jgi:hypothetical protein
MFPHALPKPLLIRQRRYRAHVIDEGVSASGLTVKLAPLTTPLIA